MIVYDYRAGFGLELLLHSAGSALFNLRTIFPAIISGVIGYFGSTSATFKSLFNDSNLKNPAVYFSGVAFLISFVVVFRSQLAYGRFFGALTSYFRMKARLLELASETKALCLSNTTSAVFVKSTIFRWIRLFHKLALTRLRGGYVRDIGLVGVVEERELEVLLATRDKTNVVNSWIVRALSENLHEFTAPPPILGRLFQLAVNADLEFGGALQVAETPFPFPYAQITVVLLNVWLLITPLFVAPFVKDSPGLCVFLSFISTWFIFAVNESASNLESPFDGDDNDIPLTYFDVTFDAAMEATQYSPDPSFFLTQSKCHYGRQGKRNQDALTARVDRFASFVSDINNEENSYETRTKAADSLLLESGNASRGGIISKFKSLIGKEKKATPNVPYAPSTVNEDEVKIHVEASHVTGLSHQDEEESYYEYDDPEEHDDPRKGKLVSKQAAKVLFSPQTNTVTRSYRDRLPRWMCHNPISRLFAKSRRSLRDLLSERVDASTMRAQGHFKRYE